RYRRDNDALESRPSTQVLVIDDDQGVRDGCQRLRSPHDIASRRRVAVDVHATPPTNASLTTRCRGSSVGLLEARPTDPSLERRPAPPSRTSRGQPTGPWGKRDGRTGRSEEHTS